MNLTELFCRNVRIILTSRGQEFSDLAEMVKGQLSFSFVSGLRHPEKNNPTLEAVAVIAWALRVEPMRLLDPHLTWGGEDDLAPGFIRRPCVLSQFQDTRVRDWEKANRKRIEDWRQEERRRLAELRRH